MVMVSREISVGDEILVSAVGVSNSNKTWAIERLIFVVI
jgi:hypothetical protein